MCVCVCVFVSFSVLACLFVRPSVRVHVCSLACLWICFCTRVDLFVCSIIIPLCLLVCLLVKWVLTIPHLLGRHRIDLEVT